MKPCMEQNCRDETYLHEIVILAVTFEVAMTSTLTILSIVKRYGLSTPVTVEIQHLFMVKVKRVTCLLAW
jgi:hypothetical protein